jgi:transcriptional regulator with XRE-family HTH domain
MMTLADRLQTLLKKKGFSINAAAELAGMERMHVWRIVTGKTANPGILTVERIVEAVGGTMAELFEDESEGDR